mgnify:CR=1 FL=1
MKLSSKYSIIIFALFIQYSLFGQNSSSYSRFGIGDINYTFSAVRLGMGQLGVALEGKNTVDAINPAGWNNLMLTRIDFGFNYSGLFLSSNTSKTYYGKGVFNGFTFAFPISHQYGIGAAVGLIPYSNISYKVEQNFIRKSVADYNVIYEGSGGLSKLFIGSSYRLPFGLNIGASFNYYFGTMKYNSIINFNSGNNNLAEYKTTYSPFGLGSTVGIISPDFSYVFKSKDITDFRIAFATDIIGNLRTDTILTSKSTAGLDTLGLGTVTMKIPLRINAGISLRIRNDYIFTVDYMYQPWKRYSFNNHFPGDLRNASKFSAGFQYMPQYSPDLSFLEQFSWRAGLSFEQTQYLVNGIGINQYSISGGFSLPLNFANSLDVGIQYSIRGSTQSGLYKENTIKMDVDISLGELWFIRHRE